MESTEAPGVSFCLPHPELGDFFLTGSALLETVGFDLIRLGTRKQPSGRPRIASRLSDHASTLRYIACGAPKIQWLCHSSYVLGIRHTSLNGPNAPV